MECKTTTELFSDYVDGGLSTSERQTLEAHLQDCSSCSGEFKVYTQSLKALHETRPLETTRVFVQNVKSAAEEHLKRKVNLLQKTGTEAMTVVAPRADAPSSSRSVTPVWVPYALAAILLLAFGMGWLVSGGNSAPVPDPRMARLERMVEGQRREIKELTSKLAQRPDPEPPERSGFSPADLGLIRVKGQWVPKKMQVAFDEGKVCIGGDLVDPRTALDRLARSEGLFVVKELPKKVPLPKPPPPKPAPVRERKPEEILSEAGYQNVNGIFIPAEWVDRMARGSVLVGVGQWRARDDFIEEFVRKHNLVEINGKYMTAEQAEAIKSQQLVRMPDVATAFNDVTRLVDGLRIGPPMNYRNLTLYPLIARGGDRAVDLVPLHAALGLGKVQIQDTGDLFSVQIRNPLETDLLLIAGEILTGGRCARVVSEDAVVRAGDTTNISVFCVEPGAWKAADAFAKESGHYVAPPSLRRALIREQGQGKIWSMLAERLGADESGQVDLFRRHAAAIIDYRTYFGELAEREPEAVGVAVSMGDGIEFAELFQDPALLAAYLDRIVSGAALEILERAESRPTRSEPSFLNSIRGVKDLLESAFISSYEIRDTGYGIRRETARVGRALITGGVPNHVLLFSSVRVAAPVFAEVQVPRAKMVRAITAYEKRLDTLGPSAKVAVLQELSSIRAAEVTLVLLRKLNETDTTVRRAVIRALGGTGDRRASEALVPLLSVSRTEPTVYIEVIGALARLGDDRVVDPMIRQIDTSTPETAKIVVQALPDLLLQVKNRMVLGSAMGRLVVIYESAEAAAKPEGLINPVVPGAKAAEASALLVALRESLNQITGLEFSTSASLRKWWSDRSARDQFLRERTGK